MPQIDFEPSTTIDFQPEASGIDFQPSSPTEPVASVAQMASATRSAVGVIGRAVAARDFAVAGYDAPDRSQLEDGYQPDESALAPLPINLEPQAVRALPALASNLGQALTKTIPLPKVTSQEVTDAMDYLASTAPGLSQEERDDWLLNTRAPGNLEKIVAGAQRSAISIPESMTSVFGAATLGTGALGVTAGRVVAGGFAAHMASAIPEQIQQLKTAIASGDSEAITEASGNLLASGALTAATARHALTKPNPAAKVGAALMDSIKQTELVDPKLAALKQVAPLTADAVVNVNPEPTPELKPGDILPDPLPPTTTPLTAEAVKSVKEPAPSAPAPTPVAATSELGNVPARTGTEPPAKVEVAQEPSAVETKPAGWSDERWAIFKKQRQAAVDVQKQRDNEFVPPAAKPEAMPTPYGEAYIRDNGIDAARARLLHLERRFQEEATKGNTRGMETLGDEADRIRRAITAQAKPEGEQALTTGIKNSAVDSERQSRGLEPIMAPQRLANTEVWDSAMARIEKEPGWQDRLVEELKEKPRTPSAEEVVALDHRYVELQNEHAKAARDGAAHQEAGFAEGVQEATARAEFYERGLAQLEEVAHNIGTEWGRSGQMRQRLMNEDFSLAAIESRARAKKGFEPLTETEHTEILALHEKLSAANERMAMLEAQKALAEARAAAQPTYGPQVLAAAERFAVFMDRKGADALGRIRERLGRTSAGIDPTILSDVGILGAAKITRGVVDFAKWTDAMVRDLGEWFREHARDGWNASQAALEKERKDFGQAKKRSSKLDHETNLARGEAEMRRDDIRRRLAKFDYEQKTRSEKIWHGIKAGKDAFVNIASSYDFSAPRQALFAILSNVNRLLLPIDLVKSAEGKTSLAYVNQIKSAKMLSKPVGEMFRAWSSEARAGAIEQKRLARANAQSGADKIAEVHYSELTSKLTKYEENAHSILDEWARLPLKTGNLGKTISTAPVKVFSRGVRASNRAFITFLNSTRADLLDELLSINFKDRAPTTADLKVVGNYVNIATGRGKLPPKGASVASGLMWSPYLLASRVQALTGQPLWTGKWADSGRARTIVAKEYARVIMSGYLLWNVSRLFDEKDEESMTSSDFGKIVRGNTRIDPWGGLQQVTTLAARTATATTTTLKGKERDIGTAKKYWQRGLWHTWSDFGRSKLRPDVGVAVDILTRSDFIGRPTTPGHVAQSLLVPLPMRDIVGVMKEHGFTEGMIIEALGQFGAGVSQYEDSEAQR